jgi:hypothetical protein
MAGSDTNEALNGVRFWRMLTNPRRQVLLLPSIQAARQSRLICGHNAAHITAQKAR